MPQKKKNAFAYILSGIILICLSISFYLQLSSAEATGSTIRMNAIIVALYKSFGKEIASGVPFIIGTLLFFKGYYDLKSVKKNAVNSRLNSK